MLYLMHSYLRHVVTKQKVHQGLNYIENKIFTLLIFII